MRSDIRNIVAATAALAVMVLAHADRAHGQFSPAAPNPIYGVDCLDGNCCSKGGEAGWGAMGPVPWQMYAQGEYVGPARAQHVPVYRLRVDDQLELVYRVTRDVLPTPYELNVGDQVRVESFTDPDLNRDLIILPDGTISLRLLGQVRAANMTVAQLTEELDRLYKKFYKVPAITVTPLLVNAKLEDLRATVDSRAGNGGQTRNARVTPDGTIALPAIGSVPAQGLTLEELQREINARYAEEIQGIEVTPILSERAPRFVYVVGEVQTPGRFTLEGPTTLMQSISMAGGWNIGANLNEIVVFRRGDDWRLLATRIDVRGALYGKRPCPADEIWLSDSDIVVVPKSPTQELADHIELVFTRCIYGVLPFNTSLDFGSLNGL